MQNGYCSNYSHQMNVAEYRIQFVPLKCCGVHMKLHKTERVK